MVSLADLDVAVAHWGIDSPGGAEAVAVALADALDCDRVYTLGVPDAGTREAYPDVEFYDVLEDVALEPLRRVQADLDRVFEYALWEDVDWREYGPPDVLVTSGATTRAVITPEETLHLNYCHSPARTLYDRYHDRTSDLPSLLTRPVLRYLRTRDAAVDARVDGYLANSEVIARRLWKFHDRDAEVLYPPVAVEALTALDRERGERYLHLGRLDREKGVPEVVDAFEHLDHPIDFVGPRGDVSDDTLDRIDRASNMRNLGFVSVDEKHRLLAESRAVVFNGVAEDFGIVPVEAIAAGSACLARDEGFPSLFVDGEVGLRHDGSVRGVREAVERFEADPFDAERSRADPFSEDAFETQLAETVTSRYAAFVERFGR
ncbi:glycosyltransferase [Halomarina oriensis]|uniref:Glycosyltransferase n=1 Tax=Halomarina oriensis TaxID=671145 RepID=A0A6B0GGQ1_9EURY|nr:glycosyltransferase [Halomarina oriensis]MWG32901.1 glycosyltransferase [Halomarina oriensis]